MFPAVESHRRTELIDDDKKEDMPVEKGQKTSPDMVGSGSHPKL